MRLPIILAAFALAATVTAASAQVRVQGYTRQDGTTVQPHYRSAPDTTPTNNYSYPGNTNPYTGTVAPSTPPSVFAPAPLSTMPRTK